MRRAGTRILLAVDEALGFRSGTPPLRLAEEVLEILGRLADAVDLWQRRGLLDLSEAVEILELGSRVALTPVQLLSAPGVPDGAAALPSNSERTAPAPSPAARRWKRGSVGRTSSRP